MLTPKYHAQGPEGPLHPEGFTDLNECLRHAMAWAFAVGRQGYYSDMHRIERSPDWVIERCSVEIEQTDPNMEGVDPEDECFVIWMPSLMCESFETEEDAKDVIASSKSHFLHGVLYEDFEIFWKDYEGLNARIQRAPNQSTPTETPSPQ